MGLASDRGELDSLDRDRAFWPSSYVLAQLLSRDNFVFSGALERYKIDGKILS